VSKSNVESKVKKKKKTAWNRWRILLNPATEVNISGVARLNKLDWQGLLAQASSLRMVTASSNLSIIIFEIHSCN